MAKRRTTRKELVKKPDEFITQTGKVIQWARENTKNLIYGVCIFFGLIILVSGYRMYQSVQMKAASALLSTGLNAYEQATQGDEGPNEVLGDVSPEFEKLMSKYGNQAEGRLGRILFGHISLAGNEAAHAIELYEKAYKNYSDDATLRNIVLNGLAAAYMEKGDDGTAIKYLQQIADGSGRLLKDSALFHLGCLYLKSGETDKSTQYFEKLAKDFPESMYASMAREKTAG